MISIVIVNWNSGKLLERCVRSLLDHAAHCEVVVVDNASEDFSLDFARKVNAPLSLIRNLENPGRSDGGFSGMEPGISSRDSFRKGFSRWT